MDMSPLSYIETFQLIQELNSFIDQQDNAIISAQQQYASLKKQIEGENAANTSKFNSDCEAAIVAVRTKSQSVITDAKKIQSEMHELDEQLARVDKYYVKTKRKKEEELAEKKSRNYDDNGDYFEVLSKIKKDYQAISRKYSDDILPSLLNGLNYLFSNKRKQDYEDLIVLLNTVDAFVAEISDTMPELTAETVADMRSTHEQQREDMEFAQKKAVSTLENQYAMSLNRIASAIDEGLNRILPDELVDFISSQIDLYIVSHDRVNASTTVANGILYLGFIDYPIASFIQSQTLASFVNEKCRKLIMNGSIKFPVICSTTTALPIYLQKDRSTSESVLRVMQGVIYSFLSSVPVAKLHINVIDCENHGNSVSAFYEVKRKMPELFGEKIYTDSEDAAERIRRLNEKIEYISQNLLGTQYSSIFGYSRNNPDFDFSVELLTIFDFPKGTDEHSLAHLRNIIINGPKCGIFTFIVGSANVSSDMYSREYIENLKKIKSECLVLSQNGNVISAMGLQYVFWGMPDKAEFDAFFAKYMLLNESIKNRGIVFPDILKKLADSKTEDEVQINIGKICDLVDRYDHSYGRVPQKDKGFSDQIVLGMAQYPSDIFKDGIAYNAIRQKFGETNGRFTLPLTLNLSHSSNILLSYSEEQNGSVAPFTHHIIWSFLSSLPVTSLNTIIFDPDKKGGSIVPFLEFKKRCPDAFDEAVYTDSESIYERLQKLNRHIDELIQDKLGTQYNNLLEYNKNTPARAEKFNLLVVYDFPECFDSRSIDLLQNILKNGGRCGIYAVVCNNKDIRYSSYDNIEEKIEGFKKYSSNIEYRDHKYQLLPFNLSVSIKDSLSGSDIESFVASYAELADKIKNKGLSFEDILDNELFSRDLSSGLSIPVGIGDGEKIVPVVFGKGSSHHALIAGATGSGKSTLLHTIIMSSMLHYSPDLLNLYLMDFKSGTEFKVYDSKHLPHIKLLALDAMQEFGESILEDLVAEISRRSDEFKRVNASKLGEYVKATNKPMPKILVIMDEFQILFNDSTNRKVAYHCAELTKRIVTEGRSYGIHLIMATQSTKIISNLTIESGTIEQMRIRIGMKCGEWDANYLFTDKNDAKALEMMKGPIGTAVMNPEYTEEANIGFRAAYCDDPTQDKYLDIIADKFADYPCNLQTFEGNRTTNLLETKSGAELSSADVVTVEVGNLIKVAPPLSITFDRRRKHNTLVCGTNERMSENILNMFAFSILKNSRATLYCFDGERLLGPSSADKVYSAFSKLSDKFKIAESRGNIIEFVNEIYDLYAERKKHGGGESVFILIKNLQYLDLVKSMFKGDMIDESEYLDVVPDAEDSFDFGADISSLGVSDKLLKIVDDGTAYGIHIIVSSLEYQSVKECMYFGENILAKFPERYVFSLNDSDAESLIEGVSVTSLRDNTVYYTDSVKNTFQLKPYVFPNIEELEVFVASVMRGNQDG